MNSFFFITAGAQLKGINTLQTICYTITFLIYRMLRF